LEVPIGAGGREYAGLHQRKQNREIGRHGDEEGGLMNLYLCTANGVFGPFGDYIHASTPAEARLKFWRSFKVTPFSVVFERRAK
jgi:hypothetical protein